MDYGKTLNLPKTDFSMRANLPVKEPETLKKWEAERLYDGLMEKNAGKPVLCCMTAALWPMVISIWDIR